MADETKIATRGRRPLHSVAKIAGINDRLLRRLVDAGHVSSLRLPGSRTTLLDVDEVVRFMAGHLRPAGSAS